MATITALSQLEFIEHKEDAHLAVVEKTVQGAGGTWFRVRYSTEGHSGNGWLAPGHAGRYIRLLDMIARMSYLTPTWDHRLFKLPSWKSPDQTYDRLSQTPTVGVAQTRIRDLEHQEIWLLVVITKGSFCSGLQEDDAIVATGWVPLFTKSGKLNVWFSSRGC